MASGTVNQGATPKRQVSLINDMLTEREVMHFDSQLETVPDYDNDDVVDQTFHNQNNQHYIEGLRHSMKLDVRTPNGVRKSGFELDPNAPRVIKLETPSVERAGYSNAATNGNSYRSNDEEQ